MHKTYRVWLDPKIDGPVIERLGKASNMSAFINRALELYAEHHDGQDGPLDPEQFQAHVTDPDLQQMLDRVGHGQVTRILHAALWFYLGKMDGVDGHSIADVIINRLQALGMQAGATPAPESVPEELSAFLEQF